MTLQRHLMHSEFFYLHKKKSIFTPSVLRINMLDEKNELPFLTLLASSFEHNRRVGNSSGAYSRIYLQTEH